MPESSGASANGHILILDDNPDSRAFFSLYLAQEQFSVAVAGDAEEAFRCIAGRRPDVIMLDLNLAGTSGFDVARKLLDNPATENVPVVVVTALTRDAEADPRLPSLPNIRRFIYKPCRPQTLVDAVRNVLCLARLQGRAAPGPAK